VPGCWSDEVWTAAINSPQFAGRSVVYESWGYCDDPFANLYSVGADGGAVQRLKNVHAQETQPTVSPDGTRIAYVWSEGNGFSCKGCSDGIRIASADGTALRTLTNPNMCAFDDSPTWSPDGTTILFAHTGCDSGGELYTILAGGGRPHDLHVAGTDPAWGPTRIAYQGAKGLMTANPDGTIRCSWRRRACCRPGRRRGLSRTSFGDLYHRTLVVGTSGAMLPFARVISLAWSPDGTRLVVSASTTKLGPLDVYTVEPDGTDPVQLTTNYGASGAWGGVTP
jgi:Tol biopolymer transport system component